MKTNVPLYMSPKVKMIHDHLMIILWKNRSFVGGLELICNLLESKDQQVLIFLPGKPINWIDAAREWGFIFKEFDEDFSFQLFWWICWCDISVDGDGGHDSMILMIALVLLMLFTVMAVMMVIPHICIFWYTATLFRPVKTAPKSV